MKCTIKTLSHPPLRFTNDLPPQFPGAQLPGSEIVSATGKFGDLCMQEFDGGNFIARYSVIHTRERFDLSIRSHHSGLHAAIMLRNAITPVFQTGEKISINERQFTIVHAKEPAVKIRFPANQHFICFEVLLSYDLASSLLQDFPDLLQVLKERLNDETHILVNPANWADEEVHEHIRYMFTYSDPAKWRRRYFANRVRDITWKLVVTHLSDKKRVSNLRRDDEGKAHELQRFILDNLDKHLRIRDLAREMGSSESTLKRIFSIVFRMGIHKYRIYERLKVAIRLLDEGKSVKEAAAKTGWRSADLIKAYTRVYGTTPGTSKKKN